jgi:hypothetical protein
MKTTFTDLIYDTLMGNTNYPQLNFNKVNDQFCDAKNNEITILYGKTAYRIKIERLKGRYEDLTTI